MPISEKLWYKMGEINLWNHFAFSTAYGEGFDKNLALHVDDSEVTVNLCLGMKGFKGGLLKFKGVRC